jgi:hypothetical protein
MASLLAASSAAREHARWTLTARGVQPELEHVVESLLAVAFVITFIVAIIGHGLLR